MEGSRPPPTSTGRESEFRPDRYGDPSTGGAQARGLALTPRDNDGAVAPRTGYFPGESAALALSDRRRKAAALTSYAPAMAAEPGSDGAFGWKRRMGVHLAYHQSAVNRIVHGLCIPPTIWGALRLASLVPVWGEFDLGAVIILVLAPIDLATEWLLGMLMVSGLGLLWLSARRPLSDSLAVELAIGLGSLVVPFVAQTQIGHRFFEPEGRDDTARNLKEFAETKNPIPLLLIFYYHLVGVALLLGYRPKMRELIEDHAEATARGFTDKADANGESVPPEA